MQPSAEVSVPGKLILMGEHAVVYHRPGVVAAVDLRLTVTVTPAPGDRVSISLPQIEHRARTDWPEVLGYAGRARRNWERFADHPDRETFRAVRGDDPAHLVKVALGECAARDPDGPGGGLDVTVTSAIPIGSGFGSSAAMAVGVVAAFLAHRGRPLDRETIAALALEVERRQHGLPSGVDHTTVLMGGLLWVRKDPAGRIRTEPLSPSPALSRIRVFDSGPPAEATGAVVSAVRERLTAAPDGGRGVLGRMESATTRFRDQLAAPEPDAGGLRALIRDYHRCLEELGVVPDPVRELVRRIEDEGGAAKISGAGSLAGPGAGGLLVYHPEPARIARWEFLAPLTAHAVRLGAEGLRREAAA